MEWKTPATTGENAFAYKHTHTHTHEHRTHMLGGEPVPFGAEVPRRLLPRAPMAYGACGGPSRAAVDPGAVKYNILRVRDVKVGAFPMGILHKLVFILGKLDPRNEKWKERQVKRVREAMAAA